MQLDLITDYLNKQPSYPLTAGYKGGLTSKAAAKAIDKKPARKYQVQELILKTAERSLVWPEMIAGMLAMDKDDYYKQLLFVRPRFSELVASDLIIESGEFARTAAGKQAAKYKLNEVTA